MHPYEFLSPRRRQFERIRKWVAVTALALTALTFCSITAIGLVTLVFSVTTQTAVLYVGFPVSVLVSFYMYVHRYKLARAAGFD